MKPNHFTEPPNKSNFFIFLIVNVLWFNCCSRLTYFLFPIATCVIQDVNKAWHIEGDARQTFSPSRLAWQALDCGERQGQVPHPMDFHLVPCVSNGTHPIVRRGEQECNEIGNYSPLKTVPNVIQPNNNDFHLCFFLTIILCDNTPVPLILWFQKDLLEASISHTNLSLVTLIQTKSYVPGDW